MFSGKYSPKSSLSATSHLLVLRYSPSSLHLVLAASYESGSLWAGPSGLFTQYPLGMVAIRPLASAKPGSICRIALGELWIKLRNILQVGYL